MRPFITILSLVLFVQTLFAQKAVVKEVSEIAPVSKEKYVFPVISIPGNANAAGKINKQMQTDILDWGAEGFKKSIFEHVWLQADGEKDFGWVYSYFAYKVHSNTANYLCLSISFNGGRHEQAQGYTYLFDTFTGNQVKLEQLLIEAGRKWLEETVTTEQNKRVKKIIASYKDSLQKHETLKDSLNKEYDEDVLRLYEECDDHHVDISEIEFHLENNRLFFSGGECAGSWNDMRVDELGNYEFSILVKDASVYLSQYGKKLLLGRAVLPPRK